jgi:hypothetical protein
MLKNSWETCQTLVKLSCSYVHSPYLFSRRAKVYFRIFQQVDDTTPQFFLLKDH